jgi:hypothetical protein
MNAGQLSMNGEGCSFIKTVTTSALVVTVGELINVAEVDLMVRVVILLNLSVIVVGFWFKGGRQEER